MYTLAGGFCWGLGFWQLQRRGLSIHLCPRVLQQGESEEGKGGRSGLASTPGGLQLGLIASWGTMGKLRFLSLNQPFCMLPR